MPVRVLIVDDHEPVRRGIRSLLARRADWSVCGEAADGIEATERARELRPDVILMDMSMPRMNGAEATRIIRREVPEAEIIIVTQNDPVVVRQQAEQIGARGYVSKAALARDLLPAILKIVGGEELASPSEENLGGGWLTGGGDLGHLIRQHDWTATPLGPIQLWPQSLKTSVALMLNSQHPMWIGWGAEMTFLYNDAYISVLSLAKHPGSLGRPAREVWPEIWDICGPLAEKVFARGEPSFVSDVRLFMSRGEYFEETYYSFSYSPIYDESGKVSGLFCPSAETTPKILHARRLRTLSELSTKALIEKSTEAACASCMETISQNPDDIPFALLYLIDETSNVAALAGSSRAPTGVSAFSPASIPLTGQRLISQPWPVRDVIETGQLRLLPLTGVDSVPPSPSGHAVTEAIILPVTSPGHGRSVGVLVAGVNPTRKVDAEYRTFFSLIADQVGTTIQNARAAEQEKKRADALAEIDRAKTLFFSNVSHEFRTPLTLMLGPLEDLLSKSADLPSKQREQLTVAHRNSLRLLRLVNTLLDFSRAEAGRLQATYEPTDLSAFTTELASVFRSAIERAGVKFNVTCDPLNEPVYVDREMWEKIVFNLLSNAFKFTFEGTIEVSLQKNGGGSELTVRDTGTGIPADELPHVFERFHRVKGSRGRTFEGSGIGLALVQELTRLHGGTVRVESAIDRGTAFTVAIPFGKNHLAPERIGAARETNSTGVRNEAFVVEALRWLPEGELADETVGVSVPVVAASGDNGNGLGEKRRARILLADDNADMREYVRRLLSLQYDVEAVADGEAALEAVRRRGPDLVLTDVMMPKMDGFDFVRKLRWDDGLKNVPVILLSARAGEEQRVEGLEVGADDYLTKPFTARELLARVATHLNMAELRRQNAEREARLREEAEIERNHLRLAQAAAHIGTWEWDPGRISQALSPELHRIFGTDATDPDHAAKWRSRVHHDDLPRVLQLMEEGRRSGEMDFEYRYNRPDAGLRWLYCKGRRLGDDSRMFGVVLDITDRKNTEEALSQGDRVNRLLAAIVDSSDDAIVSKNLDGVITSWNKGAERIFGYPEQEAVGRHISLIIPSDRRDEETEILARLRRGERVDHFETIRRRKDGTLLNISLTISPVKDASGRVIGASKVARNITERIRAEERERRISAEALAATAKFRAVFEQTTVFAGIMTKEGTLIEANKLCLDACGYSAEDVLGKMFWETPWWRNFPESQEKIQAATPLVAKGVPYREMLNYSWADGTQRFVEFALYPIIDDKGEILYLHPTGVDVTDQKRTQENYRRLAESLDLEVRARTKELEERNLDVLRQSDQLRDLSWRLLRMQDEERRHIARELHDSAGQLLTVLGMNLSAIVDGARQSAPEIKKTAEETQELVQQLTREIRTTSYLLHPPLLDENGLAPALSWYIEGLRERSSLDITLSIPNGFGRLPLHIELVIFRFVQECLTNIHRHSGSKVAEIKIAREPDNVLVEVRDRGKGIAPQRLAEIRGKGSGVGIKGLSERLRQFKGEMRIDSSSAGTAIRATIPIATEASGTAESAQAAASTI